MGLQKKISTPASTMKSQRRKPSHAGGRLSKPEGGDCHRIATHIGGGSSVTDKLEALKSLVPSENSEINADQLFQETADYIVLLETQVLVLQKLIDFYGSQQPQQNRNSV
ncbi:hypothetical protein OROGR_018263 [Orobanche gracilis]